MDVAKINTKNIQNQQSGNSGSAWIGVRMAGVETTQTEAKFWHYGAVGRSQRSGQAVSPLVRPGRGRARGSETRVQALLHSFPEAQVLDEAHPGEDFLFSCLRFQIIPLPLLLCFGNSGMDQ